MTTIRNESPHDINGIHGRMHAATTGGNHHKPGTFTRQRWSTSKPIDYYGEKATLRVELRFDDDCRNGHNTFSITGEILSQDKRLKDPCLACGCLHHEIATYFPELEPLLRWHLCSTDGPMHYVANTVYQASDRDHNGKRKGEACRWKNVVRFKYFPITFTVRPKFAAFLKDASPQIIGADCFPFEIIRYDHERDTKTFGSKFTFGGFGERWHDCPFDSQQEAAQWAEALRRGYRVDNVPTAWSEGKERNLDAARETAVWPDATDAELCAEPEELRAKLEARLPALLAEFRADMESCGFLWSPAEVEV